MNKQGYQKEDKGDNFPWAPGFRGLNSSINQSINQVPLLIITGK